MENKKRNIYIADDDSSIRSLLSAVMDRFFSDYNTSFFKNGGELYDRLSDKDTSDLKLILTDNDMPKKKGLELTEVFSKQYPNTPFLIMSGNYIETEAIKAGAREFIHKPFGISYLRNTLEKYL